MSPNSRTRNMEKLRRAQVHIQKADALVLEVVSQYLDGYEHVAFPLTIISHAIKMCNDMAKNDGPEALPAINDLLDLINTMLERNRRF